MILVTIPAGLPLKSTSYKSFMSVVTNISESKYKTLCTLFGSKSGNIILDIPIDVIRKPDNENKLL